jgi:pyridoxamine 5'-phosphate oxidase family protein
VNPWSLKGIKIYGTADIVAREGQGYLKDSGHASTEYIRISPKKKWAWGINEPVFQ